MNEFGKLISTASAYIKGIKYIAFKIKKVDNRMREDKNFIPINIIVQYSFVKLYFIYSFKTELFCHNFITKIYHNNNSK